MRDKWLMRGMGVVLVGEIKWLLKQVAIEMQKSNLIMPVQLQF